MPPTPPPPPLDVPSFARAQLSLLEAELAAEVAETSALAASHSPAALQRAGVALANLNVGGRRTGLGGRTVVELVPDPAVSSSSGAGDGGTPVLPEHGIRAGDVVVVAAQAAGGGKGVVGGDPAAKGAKGVVARVTRGAVGVALDEEGEDAVGSMSGRVWVVKLADDVTYKR